ncbi:MAG: response regulator [Spirosomataceae bacterium]
MTTISIYEDNERLRELVEMLVGTAEGYKVRGSYHNCEDILTKVENDNPDVIIMDIDMPDYDGLEGVRLVKSHRADVKVIMHTVFDDDDRLFTCLSNGADGYILKKDAPTKLFQAIGDVMEGGAPMSPGIAKRVLQSFRKTEPLKPDYNITEREKEILELLTKGFSYKMIAYDREISIETVRRHLKNIYQKLHVQCGTEAVAKAIREEIIRV